MGDRSFWRILRGLVRGPAPLVALAGRVERGNPSLPEVDVTRTPVAATVLSGEQDWIELAGIDRWHGGVHLTGRQIPWRWDPSRGRVVPLATGPGAP